MNYLDFKNKYINTKLDFDKRYWYQCVDLILYYLNEVFNIQSPYVWNAISSTTTKNTTLNKLFSQINYTKGLIPQAWDIVIFKPTSSNIYWHIAIVDYNSTETQLNVIEQNASTWNGSWLWRDSITFRSKSYDNVVCFFRYTNPINLITDSIMSQFENIKKAQIFNTSKEDYSKSVTLWDVKDLIEISFYRYFDALNKGEQFPIRK